MTETKLGTTPDATAQRDAVHIATIPVIAGEMLYAGQRVEMHKGKAWRATVRGSVGVVDPFLKKPVDEGQRFFLCLEPGSITSLRHDWTHPEFESILPVGDEAHDR